MAQRSIQGTFLTKASLDDTVEKRTGAGFTVTKTDTLGVYTVTLDSPFPTSITFNEVSAGGARVFVTGITKTGVITLTVLDDDDNPVGLDGVNIVLDILYDNTAKTATR